MNPKRTIMLLVAATILMPSLSLLAQDQAIYFNGTRQWAEFAPPTQMPKSNENRTIEFWLKASPSGTGTYDYDILQLGKTDGFTSDVNGEAFGVYATVSAGTTELKFWGHKNDMARLATLPNDDKWYFIAITYDGSSKTLKTYINGGETETTKRLAHDLATALPNKCAIGGYVDNRHNTDFYLRGAVDRLAIWKGVRTAAQIKDDMILHYGNMDNLVAYFDFNKGTGISFVSKSPKVLPAGSIGASTAFSTVTGTLNEAQWTTPIDTSPTLLSEGIWFVIQNKSDVDTDLDLPARRLALKANEPTGTPAASTVGIAAIPLTGDFDSFLWKVKNTGSSGYKLVNKMYANKVFSGDLKIGAAGTWQVSNSNISTHGTNAYTLTSGSQNLQLNSGALSKIDASASDTKQVWLFQPIRLVAGYHIPSTSDGDQPTTQKLITREDLAIYGSNTASDFAMLNVHLIVENMVNALNTNVSKTRLNGADVVVFTRFDYDNAKVINYPHVNIPIAWLNHNRGGQHSHVTLTSEEFMCKTGVYTRNNSDWDDDKTYREFDHIIHEFGHAIDKHCGQNGSSTTPLKGFHLDSKSESYAYSVQAWFNNNFGGQTYVQNRQELKLNLKNEQYAYLNRAFNETNTWAPPRNFRKAPVYQINKGTTPINATGPNEISSGTTITSQNSNAKPLLSALDNNYLNLESGGNLISQSTIDEDWTGKQWSSFDLGIPTDANSVTFKDGQLTFSGASGTTPVATLGLYTSTPNTKLALSSGNGHRGYLRIIDANGKMLWQPEILVTGGGQYIRNGGKGVWNVSGTDFEARSIFTTTINTFWVRNTGENELKITAIRVKDQKPGTAFTAQPVSVLLKQKAGRFFDITFAPPGTEQYSAQVEIAYQIKDGTTVLKDNKTFTFAIKGTGSGTPLTDGDGNSYKTVLIGNQLWMAENLRTTMCNDGTSISQPKIGETSSTPAMYWHDNLSKSDNSNAYGPLYNWAVVKDCDVCPEGWSIPSQEDWNLVLRKWYGAKEADGTTIEEGAKGLTYAAKQLREKGDQYWPKNNIRTATNSTGFSARPGGWLWKGKFRYLGKRSGWWGPKNSNQTPFMTKIADGENGVWTSAASSNDILYIRCVKDLAPTAKMTSK